MQYKKVTAIVMCEKLNVLERALVEIGVSGVSITQVRGYGEYHDFYQSDMMTRHACVDIFCRASRADIIVNTIMDVAHDGQPEDGIVAVMPVDQLYRIRTKSDYNADVTD